MNILITNDDGIDSIGLRTLARKFSEIGDVYVVAPEGERSSNSHCLNIKGKIRYEERIIPQVKKAYALWGTPADCAHMGIRVLVEEKIDLLVSGINRGRNVSTDIIYSGTIGAAREAFIDGIPAMALSLNSFTSDEYEAAADYGLRIARAYLESENRKDYFLNVNVPAIPEEQIKGIMVCDRVGDVFYNDDYSLIEEEGISYIRIENNNMAFDMKDYDLRIDYCALDAGYVSVSPLKNDHIDLEHVKDVEGLL